MSELREPFPGKLVMSIFAKTVELLEEACTLCTALWGEIEQASSVLPFNQTDYYRPEFGTDLVRRFYCFKKLVPQNCLINVKLNVHKLEYQNCIDGRRKFNIDPGILTLERLILATGKNYTHRIYLGEGVFADLTLIFKQGSFRALQWTYPDYASPESIEFWNGVRQSYLNELKERGYL